MDSVHPAGVGPANIDVPVWVAGKDVDVSATSEEAPGAKFIGFIGWEPDALPLAFAEVGVAGRWGYGDAGFGSFLCFKLL